MVSDNGVRYDLTQGCALFCLSCLKTGGAGDDGMCNHMVAIEGLTRPHAVEHPFPLAGVCLSGTLLFAEAFSIEKGRTQKSYS